MKNKLSQYLSIFLIILLTSSCSVFKKGQKEEANTDVEKLTKKKRFEPNPEKRAEAYVDAKGGIFSGKARKGVTLGDSNIMWKATLEALDEMPIKTADYAGGVIVTDWYNPSSSNESISIKVSFLSDEITLQSINVKSYKRKCENINACSTRNVEEGFNKKIKEKIFDKVKAIQIKNAEQKR